MPIVATVMNRRAPSPEIRARDTSLDRTANGSAGVNSGPDVDAGVNSAAHLGGQRCGDHEDRGDSTNYRKLAEHKIGRSRPSGRFLRRQAATTVFGPAMLLCGDATQQVLLPKSRLW